MPNICVYTTDYGDYSYHYTVPKQTVKADYYLFTENPKLHSEGWQTIHKPLCCGSARMNHKYIKFNSHRLFPTYDYTIYIDLGWQIVSPTYVETAIEYLKHDSFVLSGSNRTTMHEEIQAARTCFKYDDSLLDRQEEDYLKAGFPSPFAQMCGTGMMFRDNSDKVKRINEETWDQSCQYGALCQACLPFSLWKLKEEVKLINIEDFTEKLKVKRVGHAHNVA